ncbi:carbohydrate ABC transporter permease [Cohnella silvisoli]|uniref:Carbohydrate ABC transporter permease n=1 Tax=Cohnella silvisoli TaxID=2873699 RepID=A0ABV1L020_9BACL|nr:carbohydrate ABC transporter permease [Cohnella silvisoli]MCD9024939.1 carbohydrate ABC transporter permease [Cohnella silvisoli]
MLFEANRTARFVRIGRSALRYSFLYAALGFICFPLLWMLSASLKSTAEIYRYPMRLLPAKPQWNNYVHIFEMAPLGRFLLNSFWYAGVTALATVAASSLAAYAFARLPARGSQVLMVLTLATLLLPGHATMIPQYLLFNELQWINSYLPLVIPAFAGSAYYILLIRQFYTGIPRELEDAVKIDGGGRLQIYTRIMLPLSVPPLVTSLLLEFIGRWNDLFSPLLYLNDERLYPVALGLTSFSSQYGATPWPHVMAASTIALLPLLLLFFLTQRYFLRDNPVVVFQKRSNSF